MTAPSLPAGPELTLASILDSIQDVFYRVDAEGRIDLASRSMAAELGYQDTGELLGRQAESLWAHPERRASMLEAVRRDGEVRDWEAELLRRDGSVVTVATTVRQVRDGEGRDRGYQGIWRNITGRKRAEEELRASREMFAQIFRTAPDTIVVSRAADGLLLDVNPGFEAATGYARDEAVGRSTVSLDLWVDAAARDDMVRDLKARGEVLDREFTFRRKDGAHRAGVFSARLIPILGEACVVFLMRDVTERRAAGARERLQEQRLAQAVEAANLGTWDWDPRTGAQHVNARWGEMLGLAPGELDTSVTSWRERIHPEDAERVTRALDAYLAGQAPMYEVEHRLRHRDGHWVWVLAAGASGFLNKDAANDELIAAVHKVLAGRKYISVALAEKLAEGATTGDRPAYETLSDREMQVLQLLASGQTVSEVADAISLSVNTISTYRNRLLEKLNLNNNAELTRYALDNKLV